MSTTTASTRTKRKNRKKKKKEKKKTTTVFAENSRLKTKSWFWWAVQEDIYSEHINPFTAMESLQNDQQTYEI